jgi:hypothetical protein
MQNDCNISLPSRMRALLAVYGISAGAMVAGRDDLTCDFCPGLPCVGDCTNCSQFGPLSFTLALNIRPVRSTVSMLRDLVIIPTCLACWPIIRIVFCTRASMPFTAKSFARPSQLRLGTCAFPKYSMARGYVISPIMPSLFMQSDCNISLPTSIALMLVDYGISATPMQSTRAHLTWSFSPWPSMP